MLLNSIIFWFMKVIWWCRLCSVRFVSVLLLSEIVFEVGLKKCGSRFISVVLLLFDGLISVMILFGLICRLMLLSVVWLFLL